MLQHVSMVIEKVIKEDVKVVRKEVIEQVILDVKEDAEKKC